MKGKKWLITAWLLAIPLILLSGTAHADLTDAQYALLYTDITSTHAAEFATAVATNDDQFIANAYNTLQSPTYWVWRTSLTDKEIYEVTTSPEGTAWDWATYIGQPQAERSGWDALYRPGVCNPSLGQTRAAWAKIFHGGGASSVQLTHLLTIGRRTATRAEALFAVAGSGNGSTATPSVMGFEGQIRPIDIAHCLRAVPLP